MELNVPMKLYERVLKVVYA